MTHARLLETHSNSAACLLQFLSCPYCTYHRLVCILLELDQADACNVL
jgi:hypothetical protein